MTRRMEDFIRRLLYLVTMLLVLGAVVLGAHITTYRPEPLRIQLAEPSAPAGRKADAADPENDPMISKLASMRMSKMVIQAVQVPYKPPAPNLSMLLRVKGIMDFGDPKSSEAIIESMRGNSTKNYKINELVDGVDATVLKIDTQVTFSYDGKEIQLGVNSDVGIELPVAGQESAPALTENRPVRKNP